MLNIIRRHRLTWLGHIGRMSDERLVKRLLFGQLSGTRRQGRPRSTLRSVFRDDFLSISGALPKNRPWLVLCQDRRLWRDQLVAIGTAPPPAPPDQAPYVSLRFPFVFPHFCHTLLDVNRWPGSRTINFVAGCVSKQAS